MVYIILIGVFTCVFCLVWLGLNHLFAQQIAINTRLKDMGKFHNPQRNLGMEDELQEDFMVRIVQPLLAKLSEITQKYTPVRKREFIEKKLDYAGRPFGWSSANYLATQYVATMGIAILTFILSFATTAGFGTRILYFIIALLVGYLLVDIILTLHIKKRQQEIEKELPDVLDLLTISIEAGLGFDAAVQRVVQKSKGPLSVEFNQALQEMRMGKTRRESMKELGQRNGVDDLTKFVEAIIQADQLGVSLGSVLRNQSDQMRILRRQRVQEQAMKAPVKILIPMVLFIFPTIFVVVLAPTILKFMDIM